MGPEVWPLKLGPAGCGNGSLHPTLTAKSKREQSAEEQWGGWGGVGVRGKPPRAAGPDSLESGGSGESGPASLGPEGPGSRGEERRGGQGSHLAGPGPVWGAEGARRWPLCHCGLGGAWTTCKTPPVPTPAGQGQCAGFSALTQGTPNTATPTAGTQRRSPLQEWSQLGHSIPGAWEQVLLPGCWASPAFGHRPGPSEAAAAAHQLFPQPGQPGFVCIESAGSVCPGPAGTEGQGGEQEGGWVGGGGQRLKV